MEQHRERRRGFGNSRAGRSSSGGIQPTTAAVHHQDKGIARKAESRRCRRRCTKGSGCRGQAPPSALPGLGTAGQQIQRRGAREGCRPVTSWRNRARSCRQGPA